MDTINIEDHMAKPCKCGSVKFNLLKSMKIECAGCGAVLDGLLWSESNLTKGTYGLVQLKIKYLISTQSTYINDIIKECSVYVPRMEDTKLVLRDMISSKEVRLKEDVIEHEYEYVKGSKWKD